MAVLYKEKYLSDIASLVRKGSIYFEEDDRPQLDMGGRRVFVGGVSYDQDLGRLTFVVQNAEGATLLSASGPRPLDMLGQDVLRAVKDRVKEYSGYKLVRGLNVLNIEAARRMQKGCKAGGLSV